MIRLLYRWRHSGHIEFLIGVCGMEKSVPDLADYLQGRHL